MGQVQTSSKVSFLLSQLVLVQNQVLSCSSVLDQVLSCSPVSVSLRLAEVRSSVQRSLADDFDTPRAVGSLMDLVHHGNIQLRPVAMVTDRLTM